MVSTHRVKNLPYFSETQIYLPYGGKTWVVDVDWFRHYRQVSIAEGAAFSVGVVGGSTTRCVWVIQTFVWAVRENHFLTFTGLRAPNGIISHGTVSVKL